MVQYVEWRSNSMTLGVIHNTCPQEPKAQHMQCLPKMLPPQTTRTQLCCTFALGTGPRRLHRKARRNAQGYPSHYAPEPQQRSPRQTTLAALSTTRKANHPRRPTRWQMADRMAIAPNTLARSTSTSAVGEAITPSKCSEARVRLEPLFEKRVQH